jgi:hypothetical protein
MADFTRMRYPRMILGTIVSLLVLAGCGYDEGGDLGPVVEAATPAGARTLTACGGSGGLIEPPSHSCAFFAPGDGGAVTAAVAGALRRDGFDVACRRPGEVTAVRDDIRVLAEVTQYGSVVASGGVVNVFGAGFRPRGAKAIPAGSVALKIDASRLVDASASFWRSLAREGGSCAAPLQKPNLAEHCVNWWNGVGMATGDDAIRRGARPPVEIRTAWGIETSTCTYTLRARRLFLRVTARFDRGEWVWPPLRKLNRPGTFRPNARLNEDGRLDLTT